MRVSGLLVLVSLLASPDVRAQACASCTPLALPTSVSTPGGPAAGGAHPFVVTGQVAGGWLGFPTQSAGGQPFDDPNRARIDLALATFDLGVQHRSGFGGALQLPAALVHAADVTGARADPGLGDLDVRGRYVTPTQRWGFGVNAGVVLPTGRYAPRSGALALSAAAQALTPGRGTTWAATEVRGRFSVVERLSLSVSAEGRVPLSDAPDGFRWGLEARGAVDAQLRLPGDRVFLGLGLEAQWRGTSSVEDPFLGARVDSGSTGGVVVAALPGVTVQLPAGVFAQVSARVPLYQQLAGLQFNQGLGLFLGVGVAIPVGPSRAEESRATTTGAWTVVDYDAEWCEACRALRPVVEAARTRFPGVQFNRVDVTAWTQEELEAAVPGATALPVVEVRGPDGRVVARHEGDSARQFTTTLEQELP
ncbi:MAG: thioredoxin domain-containing protein [Myxococcaceae bacterium]|nr:thioredoxin domain-containing protein [Myxococcaceae bacterium]